jgi:hypothetical protein
MRTRWNALVIVGREARLQLRHLSIEASLIRQATQLLWVYFRFGPCAQQRARARICGWSSMCLEFQVLRPRREVA